MADFSSESLGIYAGEIIVIGEGNAKFAARKWRILLRKALGVIINILSKYGYTADVFVLQVQFLIIGNNRRIENQANIYGC